MLKKKQEVIKMIREMQIIIPEPNIQMLTVTIDGTAPLIFHQWSEKAKRMIEDK